MNELQRLYPDDSRSPLRITEHGLWHATPLAVLAGAIDAMRESGLFQGVRAVFDAGSGDGRVLAALSLASAAPRLVGIECDDSLAKEAESRLAHLPEPRPQVVAGDFFEARTWASLGVSPGEVDLVLNYPDGNERQLHSWLSAHGRAGVRLAIVTPSADPGLGEPVRRLEVHGTGATWRVFVYAPAG